MNKYIGLDIGDVRIGVSKSDPMGIIATAYEVIDRNKIDALHRVLEILKIENTNNLVVGLPKRLDGTNQIQVEKVEKFIEDLKKKNIDINVSYMDERFTTKEAEYYLKNYSKKNGKERRKVVDMVAATIILQTFLDKNKFHNMK